MLAYIRVSHLLLGSSSQYVKGMCDNLTACHTSCMRGNVAFQNKRLRDETCLVFHPEDCI